MNWVKKNRAILEKSNYVLKADTSSNYWFGISQNKIDNYRSQSSSEFNIILFGSDDNEDFYTLPFAAIKDLLNEENLYFLEGKRQRWVGDIRNHILRIRNSKVERNISEYYSLPIITDVNNAFFLTAADRNDYSIENNKREIAVRIKQSKFRKDVLKNFDNKCCLTGIMEKELLVASHIIPWSHDLTSRLDPHNGFCLSALYDKLFDKGYFTVGDNLDVILTSKLSQLSSETQRYLLAIQNKRICAPKTYEISLLAIRYHRKKIFEHFK